MASGAAPTAAAARYTRAVAADGEQAIRDACERRDWGEAAKQALSVYEVEVYSFLCARLRSEADAHEVFAQVREDMWRGLEGFQWRCSLRTWLYTLARNAAVRFERSPANQAARRRRMSQVTEPEAMARSRTRPYLRTDVKDRFAALRASLSADEQTLLVLRIDRGMGWEEVVRVFYGDESLDEAEVRRKSVNLRQRFRTLKRRLTELAAAEGLLDEG
jgi:RNA polymerase sigma-70 factor (ECF subfamily)